MGTSNMSISERKRWGIKWESARHRLMRTAQRKGVDLSKIAIVPDGEPNICTDYVAPWETAREAQERERREAYGRSGQRLKH